MAVDYSNLAYPLNIDKFAHLDISAWEYDMPNFKARSLSGFQTIDRKETIFGETNITAASVQTTDRIPNENARIDRKDNLFRAKLYIPGGIGDSVRSEWGMEDVGFFQTPKQFNQADVKNFLAGLGASSIQNSIQGWFRKLEEKTSSRFMNTAEAALGVRFAPNSAKVFKGSQGRDISLRFSFTPKSRQEADMMVNIIDAFRNSTLPELTDIFKQFPGIKDFAERTFLPTNPPTDNSQSSNDTTGIFSTFTQTLFGNVDTGFAPLISMFRYPPIFDIRFVNPSGGIDTPIRTGALPGYYDMCLESFDVVYSDGSPTYTYFRDNNPTSANLTLNFSSIYPAFRTVS